MQFGLWDSKHWKSYIWKTQQQKQRLFPNIMTRLLSIATFLWAVLLRYCYQSTTAWFLPWCRMSSAHKHLWIIVLFWVLSAPQTKYPWASWYWVEIQLISPNISYLWPDCTHGEDRFRSWCTLPVSLTWAPGGWRTWRHRGIWCTWYRSENTGQTCVPAPWAGRSQSSAPSAASWGAEPGLAVCSPTPRPPLRPSPACQRERTHAITEKTCVSEMPQHDAGAFQVFNVKQTVE